MQPEFDAFPPTTTAPPAAPRRPWVWWILALMGLAMVWSAVAESFVRDEEKKAPQSGVIHKLREYVQGSVSETKADPGDLFEEAAKKSTASESDALTYVITAYEARKEPDPRAMELLAASASLRAQLGNLLYREPNPDTAALVKNFITEEDDQAVVMRLHATEISTRTDGRSYRGPNLGLFAVLVLGFVGALIGGVALWLLYFVRRQEGRYLPRGFSWTPYSGAEADRMAMRAVIMLSGYFLAGLLPGDSAALGLLLMPLGIVFGLFVPVFGVMDPLQKIIGPWVPLRRMLSRAVLAEVMLIPVILLVSLLVIPLNRMLPDPSHPINDVLKERPAVGVLVFLYFQAAIFAPLVEEIIFRGLLAPAMSKYLRPVWGVALSSLLFASIHPQGLGGIIPLACIGAMFAAVAYHEKSLAPSIFMHAIHNFTILTIGYLLA